MLQFDFHGREFVTKQERNENLIKDRLSGMTREELAQKYDLSLAMVKTILYNNNIVLDSVQRQKNAYESKLKKNPDAMSIMRKSLTKEVVLKRSESIREAYKNPDLIKFKTEQIKDFYKNKAKQSKYTIQNAINTATSLKMSVLGSPTDILPEFLTVECFCGTKFSPRGFDFIYGKIRSCGCVKSVNQNEIAQLVQSWGLDISINDRTIIPPLELDIFIPSKKIAIEYCGIYYHGETKGKSRNRHLDKYLKCKDLGIRLITIFSDEWILKKENVIGYLKSILNISVVKVGARKTKLEEVSSVDIMDFMDSNHIQGGRKSSINLALKLNEEIVACAAFNSTEEGLELTRWCVKSGISITGGFSKILSFVKEKYKKNIITFSDLRWSNGNTYERNGFKIAHITEPSYWYFRKNTDFPRFHKGLFRKEKIEKNLGPINDQETEWEAMQRFGYDRIWDCGLVKWVLS